MAMTLGLRLFGHEEQDRTQGRDEGRRLLGAHTPCRAAWAKRWTGCAVSPRLHEVLGKEFITIYTEVKELEFDEFMKVISPWEREHLLLHV